MIRFLTPMRGTNPKDFAARVQLLQKHADHLTLGFELILLEDDYQQLDRIVQNVQASPFPICSVHVPFPQIDGDPAAYDLRTSAGQAKVIATADIAQAVGAKKIVIHSQLAWRAQDWQDAWFESTWRDMLFKEIFEIIHTLNQDYPTLQFCLENMPLPLFADTVREAERMRYNPCVVTFQDLQQAVWAGIKVTVDLCHYDMMRRLWHYWLQRDQWINGRHLAQTDQVYGVYSAAQQPDWSTLTRKLRDGIGHFHLADSKGLWQNKASLPQGGLPLGTGEINQAELHNWLSDLAGDSTQEYTVNLEVKDRDLQVLTETNQTLSYLSQLL